jgi:hypothetical protein
VFEEIKKDGFADVDAYDALEALETKHFAPRPIIYVCSPYSGDIAGNVEKAKRYSRFVVDEGGIPITPHLYMPSFLKEESERDLAIFMDLELLTRCSEVWVFGEVLSAGMQIEIDRAQQKGKTIRYVGEEEIKCTKY